MKEAAIAGCLILLIAIGSYLGGYFVLCDTASPNEDRYIFRIYQSRWQAALFAPVGAIEELLTGRHVVLDWEERLKPLGDFPCG